MNNVAIIGSGLSGLVSAWYIRYFNPEAKITIFGTDHKGGQIATESHENVKIEKGPGFLTLENPVLHFVLYHMKVKLSPIKDKVYVLKDGYYNKAPGGFMEFENGRFSFLSGGLSALMGMKKKVSPWEGVSFFDFLKSTYGLTYAETLGSTFSRSILFCEAEDLNFQAAFPAFYDALKKGLNLKQALQYIETEDKNFVKNEFQDTLKFFYEPGLYYYHEGLGKLMDLIAEDLKNKNVHFEFSKISEITGHNEEYHLNTKKNKYGPFNQVVFTVAARDQAGLWKSYNKDLSQKLNELKYRQVSYIYSAYNMKDFNRAGLGFFAARKEKLTVSGAYFINAYSKDVEKENLFLSRSVIPGDLSLFNDVELTDIQIGNYDKVFGLKTPPLWSKVYRHEFAAPLLDKNYIPWGKSIREMVANHHGIAVTGKDFNAGNMSSVLKDAYEVAQRICKTSQ